VILLSWVQMECQGLVVWTPDQQLPGFVSKKEDEGGNNKERK